MSALTAPRVMSQQGDDTFAKLLRIPIKASTKIYMGALVVYDAGYAAPGRTDAGLIAAGVAKPNGGQFTAYDNTSGSAGAFEVTVERGTFPFNNSSSGDAIAQANCGAPCYIVDDNTVALTSNSGARSVAGIIRNVNADGTVMVEVTPATAI